MPSLRPEFVQLPKRKVLTITSVGNPNAAQPYIQALYGTAYGTKLKVFKPKRKDMKIGPFSAFWLDAHLKPKSKWTGIWNLEIPNFVRANNLVQKNPKFPVKIVVLPAGTYAQVLYIGEYSKETATIRRLHAFIAEQNMQLAGPHEEVYLTKPGPKAKTIIRYRVRKAARPPH